MAETTHCVPKLALHIITLSMEGARISITTDVPMDRSSGLWTSLLQHNSARVGPSAFQRMLFEVSHCGVTLDAGLMAQVYYGWLYIEALWVAEELRGNRIGTRLLKSAESEAIARGCHHAWLETFSFQSPDFYLKNGYLIFASLPHYPDREQRLFLCKALQ